MWMQMELRLLSVTLTEVDYSVCAWWSWCNHKRLFKWKRKAGWPVWRKCSVRKTWEPSLILKMEEGQGTKGYGQPLELEKASKQILPQAEKERAALPTLCCQFSEAHFRLLPQDEKIINLCYSKLLSLWAVCYSHSRKLIQWIQPCTRVCVYMHVCVYVYIHMHAHTIEYIACTIYHLDICDLYITQVSFSSPSRNLFSPEGDISSVENAYTGL